MKGGESYLNRFCTDFVLNMFNERLIIKKKGMEICRKWKEKAFQITEQLASEKKRYRELEADIKNDLEAINSQKTELKELIRQKNEEIENLHISVSTIGSVISQHSKSLEELTQVLETGNKFLLPLIEMKAKHMEKISQLITSDELLHIFNEKINLDKISQMKHLVDLLTILSKRRNESKQKQKDVDERSDYIHTLQEIKRLRNEKYRLGLQWNAIQKEIEEDKEEQDKLEQLKQEYTALLQKDKGEISQKQNELSPIYESAKETRNEMLEKQRQIERRVDEAQKKFEENRQSKQEHIDELSKHVAEQKLEITKLTEQIQKAKAEIAKFVDAGIQSDPPKSAIFPTFEIGKDLLDLPNRIFQDHNDNQSQTQSNAIPKINSNSISFPQQQPNAITGIDENSHYKSCLDQINFLLQQAQNLSVDQDFGSNQSPP